MKKPTNEMYDSLTKAYDFFNSVLFDNKLPPCLITLQRKKNVLGYFSDKRFKNKKNDEVSEIAMNPSYFAIRTIEETLSTLVHEQCHMFQEKYGKPGRGNYHNKEFADIMFKAGLMTSQTGKEGGKRTGEPMDHYIISDGAFSKACQELIDDDFTLRWVDKYPPIERAYYAPDDDDGHSSDDEEETGKIELSKWGIEEEDLPEEPKPTRLKFTCPNCQDNLWGKPSLSVICGKCSDDETTYYFQVSE